MTTKNIMKKSGLLLTLMLCCGFMFSQPLNQTCSNSEDIDCGDVVNGTTVGASFDNVSTCGTSNTGPGVWYNIPGTGGSITVSTCNTASYDTKISVFSGSCGNLVCVGGQDDANGCSGFTTEFTFVSTPTDDYNILVHGFGAASGTFQLSVTCSAPPTGNDACAGATPLSCNSSVSGSTANATVDFAPFCSTTNTAPGRWYEITPPAGSTVTLTTCSPNTNYDTKLSVYTGSCNNLVCVDGNDDDFDCGNSILQSTVNICGDGSTYLVLVHGFGSDAGDYELTATCAPGPANDDACGAEALSVGGSASFNNSCATAQAGEATPPAGSGGASTCETQNGWCSFTFLNEPQVQNSLWYTFQAPASGCVTINADGFDSQLAVWEAGDCGDFSTYSLLAANDDQNGLAAEITELSCLTPGASYLVQVDGFNGSSTTNGTISITDCGNAPLTIDAGDCQSALTGNQVVQDTNYLVATAAGGFPPYTYTWSGNDVLFTDAEKAAVYAASTGSNVFTVTVTDSKGCTASDDVEVVLYDVNACHPNGHKVLVCHVPPGNPANEHEICIAPSALPAHLMGGGRGHGTCYVGPCNSNNPCLATNPAFTPAPSCVDLEINIQLDNFPTETSWELRENGSVIASVPSGTYSTPGDQITETFCVDPRNCYDVTIFDSFGDGICCGFGQGNWSVTLDGVNSPSPTGGAYGADETIQVGANCKNSFSSVRVVEGVQLSAFPNPFADEATIKFVMSETAQVKLEVFSLTGKQVAVLFDGVAEAGVPVIKELDGSALENGLYVYRLVGTNGVLNSGKLVLNK